MTTFFGLIAAAILLWFVLRWFAIAPVPALISNGKTSVVLLALIAAGVLAASGRFALAAAVLGILAVMAGRGRKRAPFPSRSPGSRHSMVRSAALEMVLDHDSGTIRGQVLAGTFEGAELDALDAGQIARLHREILFDSESTALLEAYLDRRFPRWREHFDLDGAARQRGAARSGPMSKQEAYQILGLADGAGEAEIRAAHRRLMMRVHPDQGGSTFLAARINEAKDRLLSKHR